MSDQSVTFTDDVAKSLCEKLKKAELTEEERELLNAMLRIVWDVTGPKGRPDRRFNVDIDGCFESGQAALIQKYQAAAAGHSITKSLGDASITRGGSDKSIDQGKPPRKP